MKAALRSDAHKMTISVKALLINEYLIALAHLRGVFILHGILRVRFGTARLKLI